MHTPMNPILMPKIIQTLKSNKSSIALGLGACLLATTALAVPEFTTESTKLVDTIKGPLMTAVLIAGVVYGAYMSGTKHSVWPLVISGGGGFIAKLLIEWIITTFQ